MKTYSLIFFIILMVTCPTAMEDKEINCRLSQLTPSSIEQKEIHKLLKVSPDSAEAIVSTLEILKNDTLPHYGLSSYGLSNLILKIAEVGAEEAHSVAVKTRPLFETIYEFHTRLDLFKDFLSIRKEDFDDLLPFFNPIYGFYTSFGFLTLSWIEDVRLAYENCGSRPEGLRALRALPKEKHNYWDIIDVLEKTNIAKAF